MKLPDQINAAFNLFGGLLLLVVPSKAIPVVITAAMIAVAIFSSTNRRAGLAAPVVSPFRGTEVAGLAAIKDAAP